MNAPDDDNVDGDNDDDHDNDNESITLLMKTITTKIGFSNILNINVMTTAGRKMKMTMMTAMITMMVIIMVRILFFGRSKYEVPQSDNYKPRQEALKMIMIVKHINGITMMRITTLMKRIRLSTTTGGP